MSRLRASGSSGNLRSSSLTHFQSVEFLMGITRINQFEAKSGRGGELREFLQSVISVIRGSAGCRSVELLAAIEHPDRLAIIEVWDSVEDHQAAARVIPPAKLQEAMALFAEPPSGTYFRSVDQKTAPAVAGA